MATLSCDVLRREGHGCFPAVVRTADGRVLRLFGDDAPAHASWLGMSDGAAIWCEPTECDAPPTGDVVTVDVELSLDEVGIQVGPDRDAAGLFDVEVDRSVTGEQTGIATEEATAEQQRTAALTWISSSIEEGTGAPESAAPCPPLKARIADEPPDALPSLAAPAGGTAGVHRALRAAPPFQAPPRPESDDTATQVDALRNGGEERTSTGNQSREALTGSWTLATDRTLRAARWLALLLLALSALAWWLLG